MQKSSSIRKNLTNLISLSLATVLSILFILIDINLDDWAENQFRNDVKSQSYMLKSVISMNSDSLTSIKDSEILSHDEFKNIYFQVWIDGESIKKSNNLDDTPSFNLIKYDIPLNTTRITDVNLPNGDEGLATLTSFTISENNKSIYYITIYDSKRKLDNVLYLVDAALIISFLFTILITRILAQKIVLVGLKPLFDLNEEIKKTTKSPFRLISPSNKHYHEIEPIYKSINNYIISNQELMKNEQRITSDIAHELKTPISEIMTLTEIYQKFPQDPRISENFTDDILKTAYEMNNLINELLSLQDEEKLKKQKDEDINLLNLINYTKDKLNIKSDDIYVNNRGIHVYAKRMALSMILRNLIDNAIFYKSKDYAANINIKEYGKYTYIIIKNKTENTISEHNLTELTKPLFKLDYSRHNNHHYGLGLTIVKKLCVACDYKLFISQDKNLNFYAVIRI